MKDSEGSQGAVCQTLGMGMFESAWCRWQLGRTEHE